MTFHRFLLAAFICLALVGVDSYELKKGHSLKKYPQPPKAPYNGGVKIQGLIYCKNYGQLTPMPGAQARVTCLAVNSKGYESAPFLVLTPETDKHGYFLLDFLKYQLPAYSLKSCRVFLEKPAPGTCDVPTDADLGLSGAPLEHSSTLHDGTTLYSIGPFVYTPSA